MKMYVADSLVEKLEAARNKLSMTGLIAAERNVAKFALQVVYDEPTVDAEPVVRCKNCKYARPYDYKYVTCLCHPTFIHYSPADGYCYLGKKTDGGASYAVD